MPRTNELRQCELRELEAWMTAREADEWEAARLQLREERIEREAEINGWPGGPPMHWPPTTLHVVDSQTGQRLSTHRFPGTGDRA